MYDFTGKERWPLRVGPAVLGGEIAGALADAAHRSPSWT